MSANKNFEKIFFTYILENKKFFNHVPNKYFTNDVIKTIYAPLRDYMIANPDALIPKPKQLWEMVKSIDVGDVVSKDNFKVILKTDLDKDYDREKFVKPRFHSWIVANKIDSFAYNITDYARDVEELASDSRSINEILTKIQKEVDLLFREDFIEQESYGSDFFDVEAHVQDSSIYKVTTGFKTFDSILQGGWDVGTLNVFMAETNAGKSLWMQNLAVASAREGKNVLYITLEMSEKKILKRLGSMTLDIPINKYDEISLDREYMNDKINAYRNQHLYDHTKAEAGRMHTYFKSAGTALVSDFETVVEVNQNKYGIKYDLIFVDYITLIAPPSGQKDNLYLKGKAIAEGLRALAAKYNLPVITAVQVSKDAWGNGDISLESIPESKAIPETADTFFAIIRTEEMKKHGKYKVKLLKQRDGDFSRQHIFADLDVRCLRIINDTFDDNFTKAA
jgi:replicative DNA helicase